MGKGDHHFLRRVVVREEPAALDQREVRTPQEQCRGMCLFVVARLDVLIWAFEVFRNEQLMTSIGDGLLQYVLLVYLVG
jgi:hypothetical protein